MTNFWPKNKMIPLFKRKRASSILGLALDGNRLEAVSLRRTNGTVQIRKSVAVSLALSPLTGDPQLVGQEIRNHLDQAGIRERPCAVCLPLNWVLTLQTKMPELSESDRANFLQIEAERGFHSGPEALFTGESLFKAGGEQHATLLAVPRDQLETLERVLRAAKLKPAVFALGISALQAPDKETARVVTLAIRQNVVDLQVTAGGGIVALRSLDGAIETQGAQKHISADVVARELRITLGQLPGGLSEAAGKLKIFGQGEAVRQFVTEISPRLAVMGLKPEVIQDNTTAKFEPPPSPEMASSAALALAANYVKGIDVLPNFLPPKVQAWRQLVTTRLSTRKLAWAGAVAAGLVLCVAAAFGVQQWQISGLQTKWAAISPQVTELNTDQDQIKKFRPWYDKSFHNILAKLWEAFPTDNSVQAKTIELHDLSAVTCSGNAKDDESFLRLHAKLADDTNEITALHAEVRGQKPMQFTVDFQWQGGAGNGN
jgi:hypothetical protein